MTLEEVYLCIYVNAGVEESTPDKGANKERWGRVVTDFASVPINLPILRMRLL